MLKLEVVMLSDSRNLQCCDVGKKSSTFLRATLMEAKSSSFMNLFNPPCLRQQLFRLMKRSEAQFSVNKQMRVKKKDTVKLFVIYHHQRTMIVPTAAKQHQEIEKCGRKYTWRVLVWVHNFATCIEQSFSSADHTGCCYFSFCLSHVVCFPIVPTETQEKRGSRSRCVIKCNLNWMANEKGKAKLRTILCRFSSDGYLECWIRQM